MPRRRAVALYNTLLAEPGTGRKLGWLAVVVAAALLIPAMQRAENEHFGASRAEAVVKGLKRQIVEI